MIIVLVFIELSFKLFIRNNNMTMIGLINGSCMGGKDCPSLDKYKNEVLNAYATNNTIVTTDDLQIKFDEMSDDINNRVFFRKKVYLMTPYHHHLEKLGWKETDIVKFLWIIGLLLSMSAIIFGVWL